MNSYITFLWRPGLLFTASKGFFAILHLALKACLLVVYTIQSYLHESSSNLPVFFTPPGKLRLLYALLWRLSEVHFNSLISIHSNSNNFRTEINGSAKIMQSGSGIFFNGVQILHSYRSTNEF
ncbi:hypothetical protein BpHYR1_016340 [Brachionus plicatilis]|uniref:Uncharacterized protein n=1 Tax=Brachionus plicatilis TaxID=10195 RepID=A0A3M7QY94_BRAPC|nr:hypothetical protein BpHYR1_016340 [Brachionus plicatilis]